MAFRSLNQFLALRRVITALRKQWFQHRFGVNLHPSVIVSLSTVFITRARGSIIVGPETLIAFKTLVISYDPRARTDYPVKIGRRCFVGGGSMILPGVTVGDESVVAAGAVVTQSVPARCVVAGNPAVVIRRGLRLGSYGRFVDGKRPENQLANP